MLSSAMGMVSKEATLGRLLSYCCPYSQEKEKKEEKKSFLLCCPPASKSMRRLYSQRLYLSPPHMSAQFHIFYMPAQCVL